jgi:hypothetical protein
LQYILRVKKIEARAIRIQMMTFSSVTTSLCGSWGCPTMPVNELAFAVVGEGSSPMVSDIV